jgi:hypothetical protein
MKTTTKILLAGMLLFNLPFGLASGSVSSIVNSIVRDRGLEIRYMKMELKKGEELPKTVTVNGVVYPFYKTKEEAYNNTLNAGIRRDMTVVYVLSSTEKDTETVTLK